MDKKDIKTKNLSNYKEYYLKSNDKLVKVYKQILFTM